MANASTETAVTKGEKAAVQKLAQPVQPQPSQIAPVIGRASATERDPSSSEKFSFWLAPGALVNPFDIMEAGQVQQSRTFGLVTNIKQLTDAPSHLSNFISNDFGNVAEQ